MLKHPSSTYDFKINSYQSDRYGKMSLVTFFHYLQECAYLNALSNGFGYEFLENENAYWVLSRVLVQLDDIPNWNDNIQIRTWPKGTEGLFAVRDFELIKGGEVIGRVSSYWMILDKDTRRPKRLNEYEFIHADFVPDNAIEKSLKRILVDGNPDIKHNRIVYSSDMDVNGHVNNATYVKWIIDAYHYSNDSTLKEFEINFVKELTLNESFSVHVGGEMNSNNVILKNIDGNIVCVAQIRN